MATKAELTALAAQIQKQLLDLVAAIGDLPDEGTSTPTPVPTTDAALNDTVTITDIQGQTITVDKKLSRGMVLRLANTRSVNVTSSGTQVTIDQPVGNGVMTGSLATVTKVPGVSAPVETPKPADPDPTPTPTPTPEPVPATGFLYLHGVNLSGLGSNPYVENAKVGTNFRAPEQKHFDKYAGLQCRLLRLPTALERFNETWDAYLPLVKTALDQAQAKGMQVIIDLHSYYRYWTKVPNGFKQRDGYSLTTYNGVTKEWRPIGTEGCAMTVAQHAALVGKIVSALKDHPAYLGIGLANEPHDRGEPGISVDALWIRDVQTHFDAAAAASAKHKIFVGGCAYSSCRQWKEKSDALKNLKDPNGQAVFEGHNYLDKGMTGGGNWANRNEQIPIDNFINMVKPLVEWGQKNGKQVYIGEHGYPEGNASAEAATIKGLQYLTDNKVPSTQWCAGPGWPAGDVLALDDDNGTFKTNINAVKQFFDKKA